jgi:hypothetical protein
MIQGPGGDEIAMHLHYIAMHYLFAEFINHSSDVNRTDAPTRSIYLLTDARSVGYGETPKASAMYRASESVKASARCVRDADAKSEITRQGS